MEIEYLADEKAVRESYKEHFVLSWEDFRELHKDWIEQNPRINKQWYEHSFMWEKITLNHVDVSMTEALSFLSEHTGSVLFMCEDDERGCFQEADRKGFVAKADAKQLATRIEYE